MGQDEHHQGDQRSPTAPKETFATIGNETRAEILRILGEDPYPGLSFSELRSRIETESGSGQFNHHLQQLSE